MKIERGLVRFAIGSLKGKGAGALTVLAFGSTGEEGTVCGEKRLFIGKVSNNTHIPLTWSSPKIEIVQSFACLLSPWRSLG